MTQLSKENGSKNLAKSVSEFIKQSNGTINLSLGEVSDLKQIGQGGNGLVYGGIQNNQEVAIKFLVENNMRKLQRFKAEYFNVNLMVDRRNIVNYINFEDILLNEELSIPAIIMKRYDKSLKVLRSDSLDIEEETFARLFNFLLVTLKKIHENGIIHRDIKPENILVTKNIDFVLTDFGIASYNSDMYQLKAKTEKSERLANYEFSAPEQVEKGVIPAPSMDIYALGQVCQWYVFGSTHKGTNRRRVTEIFNSEQAEIIEVVVNKCLYNDPKDRYQSVDEIFEHIKEIKDSRKAVDPFDEMYLLNDAIRATCPNVSIGVQYVDDEKYIKRFVENINKKNFKHRLWFNTGRGDNNFSSLRYLGNKKLMLDNKELKIKGLWLYTESCYNDLIIMETEENEPFNINGNETYYGLLINNEFLVEAHHLSSGYLEIDDQVYKLSDLKVEEFDRSNYYKYYFIGTMYHSSIIPENDTLLDEFQDQENNIDTVLDLIKKLRRKKHREVVLRL
ncbi:protein kinase [Bacillus sp. AFS029533]|uniref:protein kinase domain-containing protein n=1 Tax=Bacillus sp. AFS029533 TaxID=2033494 RepID=UPI00256FC446|nr:protein kinase [Bacillus sp. AFS029533]